MPSRTKTAGHITQSWATGGEVTVVSFMCDADANRPVSPQSNSLTTRPSRPSDEQNHQLPCTTCLNSIPEPLSAFDYPVMGPLEFIQELIVDSLNSAWSLLKTENPGPGFMVELETGFVAQAQTS